jgi:hypothetical protein
MFTFALPGFGRAGALPALLAMPLPEDGVLLGVLRAGVLP